MRHEIDTYGLIGDTYCGCGHKFDRDNHETAYIYQDVSGHDLVDGYFCADCDSFLDKNGEE